MCLGYNDDAIRYELPYSVEQHSGSWFESLSAVTEALIELNELAPVIIYDSDVAGEERVQWFVEMAVNESFYEYQLPPEKRVFRIAVKDVKEFKLLMDALSYSFIKVKQGDLFVFGEILGYTDLNSIRLTKTASAVPVYTYVKA